MIILQQNQASEARFPPGCPVYICERQENTNDPPVIVSHGEVKNVVLLPVHGSPETLLRKYQVEQTRKHDRNGFITRVDFVAGENLRFRNGCKVSLRLDGQGIKNAIVIGFCDMPRHRDMFWYSVIEEKGEEEIYDRVLPDQLTYRTTTKRSRTTNATKRKNKEIDLTTILSSDYADTISTTPKRKITNKMYGKETDGEVEKSMNEKSGDEGDDMGEQIEKSGENIEIAEPAVPESKGTAAFMFQSCKVAKYFDNLIFQGVVVSYDESKGWWKVLYEDDDTEEYNREEIIEGMELFEEKFGHEAKSNSDQQTNHLRSN